MTSPFGSPDEYLTVAVRAWTGSRKEVTHKRLRSDPLRRMLVIDTETLTDTTQALTFGSAQLVSVKWRRRSDKTYIYITHSLLSEVLFHADDLETTDPHGYLMLMKYGEGHGVPVVTRSAFMERYFHYHCERRKSPSGRTLGAATAVFFNAPFDISRLAEDAGYGRGVNKGAFSFLTSPLYEGAESCYRRRIVIHHLDSKKSLISYGLKDSLDTDSDDGDAGRGQFLDLRQLIWGMTNKATSLASACELFGIPEEHRKSRPAAHGVITSDYIDYNRQDVAATRELAIAALKEFVRHPIDMQASKVFSPASMSKAYIRKMGVTPMLEREGFPKGPILLGHSVSTFYGGRAECRIRWTPLPIRLVDFTSMYATVNVLMRLWDYITAQSLSVVDCTDAVRTTLNDINAERLLDKELWRSFVGMVQIIPDGDILPVRAFYEDGDIAQYGVGLNHLHASEPLWYTIPDVVASTLLTGKAPQVVRAVRFIPSAAKLSTLLPVKLFGTVTVDSANTDFFKTVVEQRQAIKKTSCAGHVDNCVCPSCRTTGFLKVLANAGSYGIYVEMLRSDLASKRDFTVYGTYEEPWTTTTNAEEQAQEFCYPPIGATITGAARLMLAILERLVTDAGGAWMFCDTDSMAVVANKTGSLVPCPGGPYELPDGRDAVQALSYQQVDTIRNAVNRLNPYDADKIPHILKAETRTEDPECWGFMTSAKRYTLFNYDKNGRPIVPQWIDGKRAYSEHGLGMYLDPNDPETREHDWIRRTWQHILDKAHGLNLTPPPWFNRPALTRVAVSSPHVARCFDGFNRDRTYSQRVKPFNFILLTTNSSLDGMTKARYVAPYNNDPASWESSECLWRNIYDRNADPIPGDVFPFTRMRSIVSVYRRHPETKSLGPDGKPCGPDTIGLLGRRTVRILRLTHIGKESNRIDDVNSHMIRGWEDAVTEYPRDGADVAVDVVAQFSRREFSTLVRAANKPTPRPTPTIRVPVPSAADIMKLVPEPVPGLFMDLAARNTTVVRKNSESVTTSRTTVERFVSGAPISERNRQAIVRRAAELVAPSVGIDPNSIRQSGRGTRGRRNTISAEVVLAMWDHAERPPIPGSVCTCLCGCGEVARRLFASDACRKRYNRNNR